MQLIWRAQSFIHEDRASFVSCIPKPKRHSTRLTSTQRIAKPNHSLQITLIVETKIASLNINTNINERKSERTYLYNLPLTPFHHCDRRGFPSTVFDRQGKQKEHVCYL